MPKKKQKQEFKEPLSTYGKPRIKFFDSFEGQREEMYEYLASLTPEQCMASLYNLIVGSYGLTPEKLKNPKLDRKIRLILEPKSFFADG
jgi:hypothetical protein